MQPTLEEQRLIIRGLSTDMERVSTDQCAYLISHWWATVWQDAVGWDTLTPSEDTIVPSIDNSELLDGNFIRENVRYETDFLVVSARVWSYLHKWYGGGPEVPVPLVDGKCPTKFHKLEFEYKGERAPTTVHNLLAAGHLTTMLREHWRIGEDEKIRLLAYADGKLKNEIRDRGFSDYEECDLVRVDYQDENGDWASGEVVPTARDHDESRQTLSYDFGSSSTALGRGLVGFPNLGNTCFMNSAVQVLVHTRELVRYFLSGNWRRDLNETNPIGMKGELARAFADLVIDVWVDSPRDSNVRQDVVTLKDVIGRFAPQFSGYHQQDSHELMTFMLDGVHEDLNRCRVKPVVEAIEGDGSNDEEVAQEAWRRHKSRNDSVIVDLFHGQLRSSLVCPNCQKKTVIFDPYMTLPLPVHANNSMVEHKVVFVPYDFEEPHQVVTVKNGSWQSISDQVSEQVERPVVVVPVSCRKYVSFEYTYTFGLDVEDTNKIMYAVEIPDPEKKYVIGRVVGASHDETGPIVVEVDDFPVKVSDLPSRFGARLRPILGTMTGDADERLDGDSDLVELGKSLREVKGSWSDDTMVKVIESAYCPRDEVNLKRDATYSVGQSVVMVRINPAHVDKPCVEGMLHLKSRNSVEPVADTRKSSELDLQDCFRYFLEQEVLDDANKWHCSKCSQFVCAAKKIDIWSVPDVLVIQIKRFIVDANQLSRKFDEEISFPDQLDMSGYVIGPKNGQSMKYQLFGVSEHGGGLAGGHYTAHAKVSNEWYSFNDSFVSTSSRAAAHSRRAYLLFYERQKE